MLLFEEESYVEISEMFFSLFFFFIIVLFFGCFECDSLFVLLSDICCFDYWIRFESVFGGDLFIVLYFDFWLVLVKWVVCILYFIFVLVFGL